MKKVIIIVCILFTVVGSMLYDHYRHTATPQSEVQPTPIPQLVTYTDPEKLFVVQVPSTWKTGKSQATNTTGLKTAHPITQTIAITQIYLPEQMGLTVQINQGVPTCPLPYTINTTVGGLPDAYDREQENWRIPTTNATVVLNASYPGKGFHGLRNTVLPSQAVINADKKVVYAAVASLQFPQLTGFTCPQ